MTLKRQNQCLTLTCGGWILFFTWILHRREVRVTHRAALSPAVQHKTCQVVSVLYPYILNLNLQFNSVEKKKKGGSISCSIESLFNISVMWPKILNISFGWQQAVDPPTSCPSLLLFWKHFLCSLLTKAGHNEVTKKENINQPFFLKVKFGLVCAIS